MADRYQTTATRERTKDGSPSSRRSRRSSRASTSPGSGTGCTSRARSPTTTSRLSRQAHRSRAASRWAGATSAPSASRPARSTPPAATTAAQDLPPAADRHRHLQPPGPVAVHHLHELPAGVPQGGRHDPDHAGRPRRGGARGQHPRRAPGDVPERRRVRQPDGPVGAQATRWAKKAGVPIRILPKDPAPVEVLWFVGDYYAYHGRGVDAAKAMARVFNRLGVDFGILGADERCDGDSQRLAGEPGPVRGAGGAQHRAVQQVRVRQDRGQRARTPTTPSRTSTRS